MHNSVDKIIENKEQKEIGKAREEGNALEYAQLIIAHCNIDVNEALFNSSFACWRDIWFLDTSVTYHMTFRKDFSLKN